MIITNKHNIPEPIVRAISNDEYDKGDSVLSVTQLISPPRIVLLQELNSNNVSIDAVDRVYTLFGTAVHKILEKGAEGLPGHILEERLFLEVLGWKISGAVDLQIDNGDGTWSINDYKVTSTYSVLNEKPEWEQQLNCYAFLSYKNHGRRVTSLKIIAVLRDWQRRSAETNASYPQTQVYPVDIPVWPTDQQEAFLMERVALHQSAKKAVDNNEPLVYCTDEERWVRGEVWALMKEGRKSAVKLYDNKEDAENAAKELGESKGLSPGHYIEHRPGNAIRCAGNYCLVSQWCRQWQEELGGGAGESSG